MIILLIRAFLSVPQRNKNIRNREQQEKVDGYLIKFVIKDDNFNINIIY